MLIHIVISYCCYHSNTFDTLFILRQKRLFNLQVFNLQSDLADNKIFLYFYIN